MLGGDETPALLFTASHGVGFASGDPRQLTHQGALVCQEWGGPRNNNMSEDVFFGAEDISADADLGGLIAFHFACYGAGTPKLDDFAAGIGSGKCDRRVLTPRAFVAPLPRRLLGHQNGGALAVIGHIGRAWGSSFLWRDPQESGTASRQLGVFESSLDRLIRGHRVGHAMEYFNVRYAEMAADLTSVMQHRGGDSRDGEVARMWLHNNDARNYAIIGDPAVRLNVEGSSTGRRGDELERPADQPADQPAARSRDLRDAVEIRTFDDDPATDPATGPATGDQTIRADEFSAAIVGPASCDSEVPPANTELARVVVDILRQALKEALTLEVRTFVSEDIGRDAGRVITSRVGGDPAPAGDETSAGALRAYTHSRLDGATDVWIPVQDDKIDHELWKLHSDVFERAQALRAETLRIALSVLSDRTW